MKVDLELRHPEIEEQFRELPEAAEQIEALERGKEFHKEAASEAVPVPAEDLPRMILSRQPFTLVEFPLRGHFGKLPLIGRADALHFNGKGASWIVEFKVVKGRPYVSEWVDAQLRLYGYLLKQDKTFDAQQVFLVCVYVDAEVRKKIDAIDEDRAVRLVRMVCEETPESFTGHRTWKKNCRLPGFGRTTVSWVSFPYDPQKARSDLRFLSGYWFGKREPKPTTKPWKCRKCRVNAVGLCSVALAPYQA